MGDVTFGEQRPTRRPKNSRRRAMRRLGVPVSIIVLGLALVGVARLLGTAISAVPALGESTDFAVGRLDPLLQTQFAWHSDLTWSSGAEYLAAGLVILLVLVVISVVARVLAR